MPEGLEVFTGTVFLRSFPLNFKHAVTYVEPLDNPVKRYHYLLSDLTCFIYQVITSTKMAEAEKNNIVNQCRLICPDQIARAEQLVEAEKSNSFQALGQILYGGNMGSIKPSKYMVEQIPLLRHTNVDRSKIVAQAVAQFLMSGQTSNECAAGFFLSFAFLVDNTLLSALLLHKSESFVILTEEEFLAKFGILGIAPGTQPIGELYLWSFLLVSLGIIGKATENQTIVATLNRKLKALFNALNIRDVPLLNHPASIFHMLKEGICAQSLEATITCYVIEMASRTVNPTINSWKCAVMNQCLMMMSFAGLRGLLLAKEFYDSDTSAVWTLLAVAEQAENMLDAWNNLKGLGKNFRFARLLGYSNPRWETRNYPDLVYCAKKSAKYRNEVSMDAFISAKTPKTPTSILDEMLRKRLRKTTSTKNMGPVEAPSVPFNEGRFTALYIRLMSTFLPPPPPPRVPSTDAAPQAAAPSEGAIPMANETPMDAMARQFSHMVDL